MVEIKSYVSNNLYDEINRRSLELKLTKSEYLRLLAYLDTSINKYQQLIIYSNIIYNSINDIHKKLGIYTTPLQEIPTINLEDDK